jgi:hypothetical protein
LHGFLLALTITDIAPVERSAYLSIPLPGICRHLFLFARVVYPSFFSFLVFTCVVYIGGLYPPCSWFT